MLGISDIIHIRYNQFTSRRKSMHDFEAAQWRSQDIGQGGIYWLTGGEEGARAP